MLEVTSTVAMLPYPLAMVTVFDDTFRNGLRDCVTVMVFMATPGAETVTVALRSESTGLALAVKISVPLPVAVAGLTVSHGWVEWAVQVVLEVTTTDTVLPAV